jgi:hypothetical protein
VEARDDLAASGRSGVLLLCPSGHSEHGVELYRRLSSGCFEDLGGWVGLGWEATGARHHGLPDVAVESAPSFGGGQMVWTSWRYRFDGTRYRPIEEKKHRERESQESAALAKRAALALVRAWVKAQVAGRADAYFALYDAASFVGIKRTRAGAEKRLDFAQWKADRKRMLAKRPRVVADRRKALSWLEESDLAEGVVQVRFVQRFRVGRYADHGEKVLDIGVVDGKARILREEMLSSSDGWDDARIQTLDGRRLVSPIEAKLYSQPAPEDSSEGLLRLVLTDARGTSVVSELPVYGDSLEPGACTPVKEGQVLYDEGMWQGDGGAEIVVLRDGVGVVVKRRFVADLGPNQALDEGPWEDLVRIRLAKGAQVTPR